MDITESRHQQEMLRRRTRSLEIINRVGNTLAAELDLKKIAQIVIDAGREISGAQFGAFLHTLAQGAGESSPLYSVSGAPYEVVDSLMPRNQQLFGPMSVGGVLRIGDLLNDSRFAITLPAHGIARAPCRYAVTCQFR